MKTCTYFFLKFASFYTALGYKIEKRKTTFCLQLLYLLLDSFEILHMPITESVTLHIATDEVLFSSEKY